MDVEIGIPERSREAVARILNDDLSDEYVLYTKTRNFHWNVVAPQFGDLHRFFEAQYEELNGIIDEVAERVRALGGWSRGTLVEFTKSTRLKENPGEHPSAQEMVSNLLTDHEALIQTLRADLEACAETYGDVGTSDLLTDIMERHEKMAWMLRAMLEAPPSLPRKGQVATAEEDEASKEDEPAAPAAKKGKKPKVASVGGPAKKKVPPKRAKKPQRSAAPKGRAKTGDTDDTQMPEEDDDESGAGKAKAPKRRKSSSKKVSSAAPSLDLDDDTS